MLGEVSMQKGPPSKKAFWQAFSRSTNDISDITLFSAKKGKIIRVPKKYTDKIKKAPPITVEGRFSSRIDDIFYKKSFAILPKERYFYKTRNTDIHETIH